MALSIASVPVLTGKESDRFDELMVKAEQKRGKVDFSKKILEARRILSKAHLTKSV